MIRIILGLRRWRSVEKNWIKKENNITHSYNIAILVVG